MRIVEILAEGQLSATNISKRFPISAPAVSQHLKVLREAGLLKVEVRAQQRIYAIDPAGFAKVEGWTGNIRQAWTQRLDALDRLLREEARKKPKRRAKRGQGSAH